jgi:hypothetical protein
MAYVTWKLVFLYDNNKSIYLNKYPYTMNGTCLFSLCEHCHLKKGDIKKKNGFNRGNESYIKQKRSY